jgi:4-amino-4-deoxy-L-arabinose transferase-like glycosyltransferase
MGTATTLTVYALALTLWPKNRRFALLSMAVVAFNPMFLFISGAVNNDNLIILLAALILWRLTALLTQTTAVSTWQAVSLGVLAGLAALTKISGLGLVGLTGLTLLLVGWRQRSWRVALGHNAIVGAIALVIAGWWYGRNLALYGEWSGTQIMVTMMGPRPVTPTPAQLLAELAGLPRSFWGLFGYFSIPMPAPIYALFNLIALAGLAGWLTLPFRRPRADFIPPGLRSSWPILLGWLVILAAGFVQWTLRTPATQGR